MTFVSANEQASFYLFILSTGLTALLLSYGAGIEKLSAYLAIYWGLFALHRLFFLSHLKQTATNPNKSVSLQILFGLGVREKEAKKATIWRMAQPDVVIYLVLAFLLGGWFIYNHFNPSPITFPNGFQSILKDLTPDAALHYKFAHYALPGILIFLLGVISLTFRGSILVNQTVIIGWISLISAGFLFLLWHSGLIEIFYLPDMGTLKGGGVQAMEWAGILSPDMGDGLKTSFYLRYTGFGSIGALAPYLLLFPMLFTLLRVVLFGRGQVVISLSLILISTFLVLSDLALKSESSNVIFMMMAIVTLIYLWGNLMRTPFDR
jgi:hypothetical protein